MSEQFKENMALPFKNKKELLGSNGARLIKQLFVEYDYLSPDHKAIYTIARHDKEYKGRTYPSLYRLYMEVGDITEARFVEQYLYDWDQWERICNTAAFSQDIEKWRTDLRKKVAGQLVDELVKDAFDEKSRSRTSSAKYLLDHVVKPEKIKAGRGRPSNKQGGNLISIDKEVQADLERVSNHQKAGNGRS